MTGSTVPRHFGDPAAEYRAALEEAAIIRRPDRALWAVVGRSPAQMLGGLLTNRVPDAPFTEEGALRGGLRYAALLTPKGRMRTDLFVYRLGGGDREDLLLDLPVAGRESAREHFRTFLPPRFAKVIELENLAHVTVVGPRAAATVGESLEPGAFVFQGDDSESEEAADFAVDLEAGLLISRRIDGLGIDGYDVIGSRDRIDALSDGWIDAGATRIGRGVWETLRVESGQPEFGVDLDDRTIPLEADLGPVAIDRTKGCYTGQEVIIRILDRGHVNRHLRGLRFAVDTPTPAVGTELHSEELDRVVGSVTSAVDSPRSSGSIGLGFVRREVEVPGRVRLGSREGDSVEVVERGRLLDPD